MKSILITEELHKRLKLHVIKLNTTMKLFVEKSIENAIDNPSLHDNQEQDMKSKLLDKVFVKKP